MRNKKATSRPNYYKNILKNLKTSQKSRKCEDVAWMWRRHIVYGSHIRCGAATPHLDHMWKKCGRDVAFLDFRIHSNENFSVHLGNYFARRGEVY